MPRVTRRFEFDAGHRVLGHGGKCRFIHGHRYRADVSVETIYLNDLGMVIDFSELKTKVGHWIDAHWDHNLLLNSRDPLARLLDVAIMGNLVEKISTPPPAVYSQIGAETLLGGEKRPYLFEQKNPTAENMAEELWKVSAGILGEQFKMQRVRLWETPNCWADYFGP